MTAEPHTGGTVRPALGPWHYRRNCGIAVTDATLVVTDHRGKAHRFPLDGTDRAPLHYLFTIDSYWWMITDRSGKGIARGDISDWSYHELKDLLEPAGIELKGHSQNIPVPEMRDDAVELRWSRLARWSFTFGAVGSGLGLFMALLGGRGGVLTAVAVAFFLTFFAAFLYSWRSGAFAKPRRTKDEERIEPIMAKWRERKAKEEARKGRAKQRRKGRLARLMARLRKPTANGAKARAEQRRKERP